MQESPAKNRRATGLDSGSVFSIEAVPKKDHLAGNG